MRMLVIGLGLTLGAVLAHPAAGQAFPVRHGQPVRIQLNGAVDRSYEGIVESQDSTGLVLWDNQNRQIRVAADSIAGLELGRVRHSTGKGALIGGLAGAVLGLVAGVQASQDPWFEEESPVLLIGTGIVGFGVVGAGAGALIGTFFTHESWTPVHPSRSRITPVTGSIGDRSTLGLRVAF